MTCVLPRLSETYMLKRFVFIGIYLLYLHSILSVTLLLPFGLDFRFLRQNRAKETVFN